MSLLLSPLLSSPPPLSRTHRSKLAPHAARHDAGGRQGDDAKLLQLLQRLHRIGDRKARLGHHLPTLLRDLGQRLHLAELVRVVAQLAKDISALMRMTRRHIVVTDRDDARHDRDDLRQVFVQRRRRRGAAHA